MLLYLQTGKQPWGRRHSGIHSPQSGFAGALRLYRASRCVTSRSMKVLTLALGAVALAVVGGGFWLQHQSTLQLRRHVALLRTEVSRLEQQQLQRPAPALVESAAPAGDYTGSAELEHLRAEIRALRAQTAELARLSPGGLKVPPARMNPTVASPLVPVSAWKDAGRVTPEATVETVLFAAMGGDLETLAKAVVFNDAIKAQTATWFEGLPESTRREYGTPEKVIALMIAKDAGSLAGMQILGKREDGANDAVVRVRVSDDQGKTKDDKFEMRRSPDGWSLLVPDKAVEKYARQVSGK